MSNDAKFKLHIAAPCKAAWQNMDGDSQVRFCRDCNRNVYDISTMTQREAQRLVDQREGRVCVRFYQRSDGTILTSDCPVGRKRSFLRSSARAFAVFAGVATGLTNLSACGPADGDGLELGQPLMGTPPPVELGPLDPAETEHPGSLIMGEIEAVEIRPIMGKIAPPEED